MWLKIIIDCILKSANGWASSTGVQKIRQIKTRFVPTCENIELVSFRICVTSSGKSLLTQYIP